MANNTYIGNKNSPPEKGESGLGLGVTPSQWATIRVAAKRISNTLRHMNEATQILLETAADENATTTALTMQYMTDLLKVIAAEVEKIKQALGEKGEQ
ncbi:MAG: hypothetical protein JHC26_10735 [Thermofilum sp.]|jgi:ABC-type phosphate/phosphonate transport system permease subunit|uniref:hypothetical protein n=1 Tax=Thermofilum sp. TaxID=1961369 RepID=UPI002582DAE6|nr:hypothetical protein [Thermofilum sp.]MCI4409557.1 hypothetical protein [Thermofilum sp.]